MEQSDCFRKMKGMQMEQLYCKSEAEWRTWLMKNYNKKAAIWLVFYKNEKKTDSINYEKALEKAICFGWIDSIIKRIDEISYVRKFTPRKPTSNWSVSNKAKVQKLISNGMMTEAGLSTVAAAKKSGLWDIDNRPAVPTEEPQEFVEALSKNDKARKEFDKLAPSHKKQYIWWISEAKKEETKVKRIQEAIALLENARKLGLK